MPNILHAIDTTGPGGAETVFVSLAEHFSRSPYQSIALIRGPGWVKSQLEARDIPVIVEESRGSVNISYLGRLVRHLRTHQVDLIHAHLPGASLYGAMAGRIVGIPVVSTYHGSVDIRSRGRMDSLRHWIVRRYSRVVAVSEPLRDELAQHLGLPQEEVELIGNGIDCQRFAAAAPLGLRARFGLPEHALLIGSLGNIRPAKAYDQGLKALKVLRDQGVDAYWFVAGQSRPGDRLLEDLKGLAADLGVETYVQFLGFVEAPERFLADLDVFLLCSSSEGHPLALTQAMAAGKAIVATRCGVEELLDGERNGWLAEVGDPPGLAEHIRRVAAADAEVAAKRSRAQALAMANYDNAAVMRRYAALYADLLGQRG